MANNFEDIQKVSKDQLENLSSSATLAALLERFVHVYTLFFK